MKKVLFITNKLYIDQSNREGGVRNCTNEFIDLLKQRFDVVLFPVHYHISLVYRLRIKLGLNNYNDYKPTQFQNDLKKIISDNKIQFVFLNLSNTIKFSSLIKKISNAKVIVCSHGNETGDYLHQLVRFKKNEPWIKRFFSSYSLGTQLKVEAYYRIADIDMVLSVSSVEDQIENWLGAKRTFMVPRTISADFLKLKPVLNRVGFFGDISHTPNYTGILAVCEALSKFNHSIEIRLTGGPENVGKQITEKYSFVTYLGFLSDKDLKDEVSTWCYFLNLVFYYSRGVSTKLAKALSWGLPVISTIPGNRGYHWQKGEMQLARNASDMANLIIQIAGDKKQIMEDQEQVKNIVSTSPALEKIMDELYPYILSL